MKLLSMIVLMSLINSCATLFAPSHDEIRFTSEPEGAVVYLNGTKIGKTPLTFRKRRKSFEENFITIKKPGYVSEKFRLNKTIESVSILNLTSALSWATDLTSGKMFEYSPNSYFIDLKEKGKIGRVQTPRSLEFALFFRNRILSDLALGHGEALDAYLDLFESVPAKHEAISQLRAQLEQLSAASDPFVFHQKVEKILL